VCPTGKPEQHCGRTQKHRSGTPASSHDR
jgi:hypothetical protein